MLSAYHRLQSEAVERVSAALDPSNGRSPVRLEALHTAFLVLVSWQTPQGRQHRLLTDWLCEVG